MCNAVRNWAAEENNAILVFQIIARLKKEIQELKVELTMITGEERLEELTQEELLQ